MALLGIILWLLLAATAGRYLIIRPTHRDDRIGALVFFIVIGLPIFILGLVLIVLPSMDQILLVLFVALVGSLLLAAMRFARVIQRGRTRSTYTYHRVTSVR